MIYNFSTFFYNRDRIEVKIVCSMTGWLVFTSNFYIFIDIFFKNNKI